MKLMTFEKFKETVNTEEIDIKKDWNKELFACPICGGGAKRDYSKMFMSNPPKYRYYCKDCTWSSIV